MILRGVSWVDRQMGKIEHGIIESFVDLPKFRKDFVLKAGDVELGLVHDAISLGLAKA